MSTVPHNANFILNIVKQFKIKRVFKKHKNSLPSVSKLENSKMDYHVLADAVIWEDEGIEKIPPELENMLRYVLNYRTNLITHQNFEFEQGVSKVIGRKEFELAKKYFPDWIGFQGNRCSYSPELLERIQRIRKISEWKIEKLMNSDEAEVE